MERTEIKHVEDLSDYKTLTGHSVDVRKIGEANGQIMYLIEEVFPERESDDPIDLMEMNEVWFDKETGDRIPEPSWVQENEARITKYAQRISERNFDGLVIDHIPYTLVKRMKPVEDVVCPNVDDSPFKVIKDGYVCEIDYDELIKVLVNSEKLENSRYYFSDLKSEEFDRSD